MGVISNILKDEQPVQVLSHSIVFGPSASGYTFAYSGDGVLYTEYSEATPANETLIVNGLAFGTYVKLKNNVGNVQYSF